MVNFDNVKDSGKRQEFSTGSVRDTDEGKGAPNLVAWEAFLKVKEYKTSSIYPKTLADGESLISKIETLLWQYSNFCCTREENSLILLRAIDLTCMLIAEKENKNYTDAYRRLSVHYGNGAKKYQKNNWRRGQFVSRYFDSAMRHLWAELDNKIDEDHLAALLWNLIAIVQTKIDVCKKILPQKLDDFPYLIKNIQKKETTNE